MFSGNYNFFDYKYNITGYSGQDFGGFPQYLYLIISFILIIIILYLLRKSSRNKILTIIRLISIFLTLFYLIKTVWESIYDVKITGSFNYGLLPFDTCSIIMLAGLIAGFGKGKIKEMAECWIVTGGIVGGIGAMVVLNAFKYYPFFSFGAFYSMIWHFLMLFLGLLLIITKYVDIRYNLVFKGFLFHLIISLFVIPLDFIFNFDFMMYKDLGSIPIFENIALKFTEQGLQVLNPIMMLILYFVSFNIVFFLYLLIDNVIIKIKLNLKK